MNESEHRCPSCGTIMIQTGAFEGKAVYKCKSCGRQELVELASQDNSVFLTKRADLLARTIKGVIDWKITQWDYLRRDLQDFMGHYDEARTDIHLHMAVIACVTYGFHNMDTTIYKESKHIFKLTERIYKQHCKMLKKTGGGSIKDVERYEEYRAMYKACRNEYRNTKLAWKLALTVAKTFLPKI